jgi:hypothetical protein
LSHYFSPHRWARQEGDAWVFGEPVWDEAAFNEGLCKLKSMTDFLSMNGRTRMPDHLLRYEKLNQDFARFVGALSLPVAHVLPGKLNASKGKPELLAQLRQSHELRIVVQDRFREDMSFFGYD